jgi:hypothetical protein
VAGLARAVFKPSGPLAFPAGLFISNLIFQFSLNINTGHVFEIE